MIRQTLNTTKLATYSIDLPSAALNGMPTPTGTGFFVSPDGWFVTAAHVITDNGASGGTVRADINQAWLMKESQPGEFIAGMCTAVRFEYINPATDFALLKVDWECNKEKEHLRGRNGFPFLTVSDRRLEEGEPVYAFGYPLPSPQLLTANAGHGGHSPRVTSAIVASTLERSSFVSSPQDANVYVLDKALNYGNSGGPIISTATGNVHALCSRFQPVWVPQGHIRYGDQPLHIMIPSLYGVVSSLGNCEVLDQLRSRGIAIVSA